MPNIRIRQAEGPDFPTLLRIDQASFPPETAYDSFELAYYMRQPGSVTLVLEEDGEIAAFLLMTIPKNRKKATMVTLDVRDDRRRRGYASLLLDRSLQILEARRVGAWELQVDVHNAGAIALYRRYGFEPAEMLKAYYADGHDAWRMVKRLRQDAGA